MNKLRRKKGETLVETLLSLIIASLAFLILPGAIISAARVNKTIGDISLYGGDVAGSEDSEVSAMAPIGTITVDFGGSEIKLNVKSYGSEDLGMYEFLK